MSDVRPREITEVFKIFSELMVGAPEASTMAECGWQGWRPTEKKPMDYMQGPFQLDFYGGRRFGCEGNSTATGHPPQTDAAGGWRWACGNGLQPRFAAEDLQALTTEGALV